MDWAGRLHGAAALLSVAVADLQAFLGHVVLAGAATLTAPSASP